MPTLNWNIFSSLPGSGNTNFESLCRTLMRRHFERFGDFRSLANQPGVEFHLKIQKNGCTLGEPGRWYGWQCKWFDPQRNGNLTSTQKTQIQESLTKTVTHLPGVTDWVLWTKHTLSKADQDWFYGLGSGNMKLILWAADEVDSYLCGECSIIRSTYFGDLILTPESLQQLHTRSVAPIKKKWQPEVHQVCDAERMLARSLGCPDSWPELSNLKQDLADDIASLASNKNGLPDALTERIDTLLKSADDVLVVLTQAITMLSGQNLGFERANVSNGLISDKERRSFLSQLRTRNSTAALHATNLSADIYNTNRTLRELDQALSRRFIAIVADAGYGKTELAAQLTAPMLHRSAGVLLHGRDLSKGQCLNDLASKITINGQRVESFEALVEAVNAAGQRQGARLPIIIDGLNEAEDPRDWKASIASLLPCLSQAYHTLIICTLRTAYIEDALPIDTEYYEISGFQHDVIGAVRKYFDYYKIFPGDAEIPWDLFNHPLSLRIFCEVTNLEREKDKQIEAMPCTLSSLYNSYLDIVADRVYDLSPKSCQHFPSDVRMAIGKIGLALWEAHSRELDKDFARRLLADDHRPWDQSIIRALEHEGILIREPGDKPGHENISIMYDAIAGYIIAEALFDARAGLGFTKWIQKKRTLTSLFRRPHIVRQPSSIFLKLSKKLLPERYWHLANKFYYKLFRTPPDKSHPLSRDIFTEIVGLMPRRMGRNQLWPLLKGPMQTEALYLSIKLDGEYIDQKTVDQITPLVLDFPFVGRADLFAELRIVRGIPRHPLNAIYLDKILRSMSMPDRDLRWSEWIRKNKESVFKKDLSIIGDIIRLENKWKNGTAITEADVLRAQWVMWTLTGTDHTLRDHATRALYWFGGLNAAHLFELALSSLSINDPYVPERMLAACYGVAMASWCDPRKAHNQDAIMSLAIELLKQMFTPPAHHSTHHALTRDYALGIIALAIKIDPSRIPIEQRLYLRRPYDHLRSPFLSPDQISDGVVADVKHAIHMDFENYTIGNLIQNRRNYDYDHPTYQDVMRQIQGRIAELGYSWKNFSTVDRMIAEDGWRNEHQDKAKTDRYGKKYSWIAYFEMFSVLSDRGLLSEWSEQTRPSNADIDPSFPEPSQEWKPVLIDLFRDTPIPPAEWLSEGPSPDYAHLLNPNDVDGQTGPWVLLNGYIEQAAKSDSRRLFSFLRGLLVKKDKVESLLDRFNSTEYPGNHALPEPSEDHYTYAGEIPWSIHFCESLRNENGLAKPDEREAIATYNGENSLPGITVEVPACVYAWESYHCKLNNSGQASVPSPKLCEDFSLSSRQGEWDLYDRSGTKASIYRTFKSEEDLYSSNLLYFRADLMAAYLAQNNLQLVWLLWGERGLHYKEANRLMDQLRPLYGQHKHIHRSSSTWGT